MPTFEYIRYPSTLGGGGGVSSLNSLTGAINLIPGSGITITPSGNNLTIASTGGALPAPLFAATPFTVAHQGTGSIIGIDSDADQSNLNFLVGSTDTSISGNSTSNVRLFGGSLLGTPSDGGSAGSVFIRGGSVGNGTGAGTPGSVSMRGGQGDAADGGEADLLGGPSNLGNGGPVNVTAGNAGGGVSGNGGDVNITSGDSASANSGNINLVAGSAALTRGLVSIDALSLNMNNIPINNVLDPTNPQDAATKNYVDTHSSGANTALSNLASVAINTSLIPGSAFGANLGSAAKPFLNEYVSSLQDGADVASVQPNARILKDSSGNASLRWDARGLSDSAGINSGNWGTRELDDAAGVASVLWNTKQLNTTGVVSVDWGNRQLKNTTGTIIAFWSNATLDLASNKITSLANPTSAQDAATKNYVDTRGINATITTAALTIGGTQGSMTFVNGCLTAQTQAT
jgi:hypothetical protein